MQLRMFKSKVHRATVTEANLNYRGSLTLDPLLMRAARMLPYEEIHVLNINTGARFTTYLLEGEPGSGVCCLNGAAARLGHPGDLVIILTYATMSEEEARAWKPICVHVDEKNHITHVDDNHQHDWLDHPPAAQVV